jgi:hypothetical protein
MRKHAGLTANTMYVKKGHICFGRFFLLYDLELIFKLFNLNFQYFFLYAGNI